MRNRDEHRLQVACVRWFRMQYPNLRTLIFSVPNGGTRNVREAVSLKAEGVLAGVSDIVLAIPNKENHGMYIEFKTPKGRQSEQQKTFQRAVEGQGYRYKIVRSFEEFVQVVKQQLRNR